MATRRTSSSVGHAGIDVLCCGTYVEAVVGTAEDVDVVHFRKPYVACRGKRAAVLLASRWPAMSERSESNGGGGGN